MNLITLDAIKDAKNRLTKILPKTPLSNSYYLSHKYDLNIHLKMENLAMSGSFKIRGASNALLKADPELIKKNGVVAASAGNHAQGVARTANLLNVKSTIFMPKQAPLVKVEKTRNLGSEVILAGESYDETEQAAKEWNKIHGAFFVHPFSNPDVIAGQGTVGLEILEDLENVGAVIVPVGGGGLISGVSTAIKSINPDIQIIGVQAEMFSPISKKFNKDTQHIHLGINAQSLADGIAVKSINDFTFGHISKHVDQIWSVTEDEIAAAIMELMERDHILSEGAGAVGVAALERHHKQLKDQIGDKAIVSIISGGNIDVSLLNRITKKGLLHSGRIMRLVIALDDRPGELVRLLNIISKTGANLYNIEHNRLFSGYGVKNVEVEIDLETSNKEHQDSIRGLLLAEKYQFHT